MKDIPITRSGCWKIAMVTACSTIARSSRTSDPARRRRLVSQVLYVAAPPDLLRFEDTDGDASPSARSNGHRMEHVVQRCEPARSFFGPDGLLYLTDGRHGFDIQD